MSVSTAVRLGFIRKPSSLMRMATASKKSWLWSASVMLVVPYLHSAWIKRSMVVLSATLKTAVLRIATVAESTADADMSWVCSIAIFTTGPLKENVEMENEYVCAETKEGILKLVWKRLCEESVAGLPFRERPLTEVGMREFAKHALGKHRTFAWKIHEVSWASA